MELLLLGGTAFLGRVIATTAADRGMEVTCLARGTAPAPPGVSLVRGDRDDEDGLAPVRDRHWDAVVDLTRQPGHARRAVRDLTTDHWVLVSSGSVYARFDSLEQGEDAPLLPALAADVLSDPSQYGAAKVACERAIADGARDAGVGATVVRAGLIGGAGDPSGRVGYYPWRFAHPTGPDVLVPPDLTFPCAFIDAADLAEWIVTCCEMRIEGVYNATGPTVPLAAVLDEACAVAECEAVTRPVPAEVLAEAQIASWGGPRSLPLWVDDPAWRYFATMDTSAARAQGLRLRSLPDTLAATLATETSHRAEPGKSAPAGLTDDDERRLRSLLEA